MFEMRFALQTAQYLARASVMALILTGTASAQVRSDPIQDQASVSTQALTAFFLHNYTATEISSATYALQERLRGLRNVYRFPSGNVVVANTPYRVSGADPSCGDGATEIGADVEEAYKAIIALGAALDVALEAGGVMSFFAGRIISMIDRKNRYQHDARCMLVCAAVPGTWTLEQIEANGQISLYIEDALVAERRVTTNTDLPYARYEPLIATSKAGSESISIPMSPSNPIRVGERVDGPSCPITLVCTRLRNWSHTLSRSGRLDVDMNASSEFDRQCLDFQTINVESYEQDLRYVFNDNTDRGLGLNVLDRYVGAAQRSSRR
jgi:hypothetical protein